MPGRTAGVCTYALYNTYSCIVILSYNSYLSTTLSFYIRVGNISQRPSGLGSAPARPYMRGPAQVREWYPGIWGSGLPLGGGSDAGTPTISFRYIIDFTPPSLRPHGVKKKKRVLTFPDLCAIIQESPAFDAPGVLLEGIPAYTSTALRHQREAVFLCAILIDIY